MGSANNQTAMLRAKQREQAIDLRVAGASYRRIGDQVGVSAKTAFKWVQQELSRLDGVALKTTERLRALELQRLDRATLGLWPAVQDGDPRAVMAFARVSAVRIKLLGLAEPDKVLHGNADGSPLTVIDAGSLADHHRQFDELIELAFTRREAARQIGSGQTEAAAAASAEQVPL